MPVCVCTRVQMPQQAEASDTLALMLQMVVLLGMGTVNQTHITMKAQKVLLTSELAYSNIKTFVSMN